ncbi:MAG: DUF2283 domain-containing protein [Patescibacteria group bacterium]|nr:MAG: DUF2283 domain-containing protein [Patescibacteria group bacterium]
MKITYDKSADAAYIYLIETRDKQPGWVKKTYSCDPKEVDGMINLDFNAEGRLGGIEVLSASKKIPNEILEAAEIIG